MSSILKDKAKAHKKILDWFSKYQRKMPWRATSGQLTDPYHVWMSEIMLQQTTVVTVGPYFLRFIERWPTVHDLAQAEQQDVMTEWAGLGYYARARNLHKCAQYVSQELNGVFPQEEVELMKLPGVGPYTAAAIRSIAFNQQAVAIDGNVERVISRLWQIETSLPESKPEIKEYATSLIENNPEPSAFTQAVMELGATVCTPKKPNCTLCPWAEQCQAREVAEEYPKRSPKKQKPTRYGHAYFLWSEERQAFFMRKRPEKGLLAGMMEIPSSEWLVEKKDPPKEHPIVNDNDWILLEGTVRHTFTHFHLELQVYISNHLNNNVLSGEWVMSEEIEEYPIPTLMKKVIKQALDKGCFSTMMKEKES